MKMKILTAVAALFLAVTSMPARQHDFGLLIFNHQICIGMSYANVVA
jgi:hypothetical protein